MTESPDQTDSPPTSLATVQVKWRTVAFAAILGATGLATAFGVVAAIKDVDILSAIALTLAIITFIAQLMIYIAQGAAATQQSADAQSLNAHLQGTLAEIRTAARSSEALLHKHFGTVLQRVLDGIPGAVQDVASANNGEVDLDKIAEAIQSSFSSALERVSESTTSSVETIIPTPITGRVRPQNRRARAASAAQLAKYDGWPSEKDAPALYAEFSKLNPLEAGQFARLAANERSQVGLGKVAGLLYAGPESAPVAASLIDKGLYKLITGEEGGDRVRLSDKGLQLAPFVTGRPPVPSYIARLLRTS